MCHKDMHKESLLSAIQTTDPSNHRVRMTDSRRTFGSDMSAVALLALRAAALGSCIKARGVPSHRLSRWPQQPHDCAPPSR